MKTESVIKVHLWENCTISNDKMVWVMRDQIMSDLVAERWDSRRLILHNQSETIKVLSFFSSVLYPAAVWESEMERFKEVTGDGDVWNPEGPLESVDGNLKKSRNGIDTPSVDMSAVVLVGELSAGGRESDTKLAEEGSIKGQGDLEPESAEQGQRVGYRRTNCIIYRSIVGTCNIAYPSIGENHQCIPYLRLEIEKSK
jgi:hypothetical protein